MLRRGYALLLIMGVMLHSQTVSPSVADIAMCVMFLERIVNRTETWEMLGYETGELLVGPSSTPDPKKNYEDQRVRRASLVRSQNNLGNSCCRGLHI